MLFHALQASFVKIYNVFAKKRDKIFRARPNESVFAFVGKWLEHLESWENLCVLWPGSLIVSVGLDY